MFFKRFKRFLTFQRTLHSLTPTQIKWLLAHYITRWINNARGISSLINTFHSWLFRSINIDIEYILCLDTVYIDDNAELMSCKVLSYNTSNQHWSKLSRVAYIQQVSAISSTLFAVFTFRLLRVRVGRSALKKTVSCLVLVDSLPSYLPLFDLKREMFP